MARSEAGQDGLCGTGGLMQECNSACEPVDDSPNLEFVGFGKGCYRAETEYHFVGAGSGEYAYPQQRFCTVRRLIIATLVGVLLILGGIFWPSSATTTTTKGPPGPKFNCVKGFQNWEKNWSHEQQGYCCREAGRACKTTTSTTTEVTTSLNECNQGAVDEWSAKKKEHCCSVYHNGCDPTTTTEEEFDCNSDFESWEASWSEPKRIWCCTNAGRGCPTTTAMFDCNTGFANWQREWSMAKMHFCCQQAGRGCQ